MAIFRWGPPTEASNADKVGNHSHRMLSTVWTQVLHTQLWWTVGIWWHSSLVSSVVCCLLETVDKVFMARRLNITPKTTEQNLIVRSGKSEDAETNNKRLCIDCVLKLTREDCTFSLRQLSFLFISYLAVYPGFSARTLLAVYLEGHPTENNTASAFTGGFLWDVWDPLGLTLKMA